MGNSGIRRLAGWLRSSAAQTRRSLPFLLVGIGYAFGSMVLAIGALLVAILIPLGVGVPLVPHYVRVIRRWTGAERRRVETFTGDPVPERYQPLEGSTLEQARTAIRDPATRRDIAWLAVNGLTGHVLGVLGVGIVIGALNAALIPAYWWVLPEGSPINAPHGITSWADAAVMPIFAAVYIALALLLVPRLATWQAGWARVLLSPIGERARLSARVSELTATRAAALEAHGAELRRIERELHDGTQNRLVGVSMHLGIIERALRRDPESALPLILKAQNAADDALGELRDVVRSIYPPVLAERGLDGAIGALAASSSVPCTLTVELTGRAPAAVETAAYFAVAEALTNVAKHSGAQHAQVRLAMSRRPGGEQEDRVIENPVSEYLVIEVTDDGHGGATENAGSGLVGIRRRVAAFDGSMELTSPDGGPTTLRVELPCGS